MEYNLDDIAHQIERYCVKWGRFGGQSKEKYGTVRFYVQFVCTHEMLHSLIYPGYVYVQWGLKMRKLDELLTSICNFLKITTLVFYWQKFIYKKAYQRVIKKYPAAKNMIIQCADYREFL